RASRSDYQIANVDAGFDGDSIAECLAQRYVSQAAALFAVPVFNHKQRVLVRLISGPDDRSQRNDRKRFGSCRARKRQRRDHADLQHAIWIWNRDLYVKQPALLIGRRRDGGDLTRELPARQRVQFNGERASGFEIRYLKIRHAKLSFDYGRVGQDKRGLARCDQLSDVDRALKQKTVDGRSKDGVVL